MKRACFAIIILALASAACLCVSCRKTAPGTAQGKRVLVLGFDGMDPRLLTELMRTEDMPNFRKLRVVNSAFTLRTSDPPQSPVAWSNFITGMNPGGHGIFDFIARNPKNYVPYLSTSRVIPPKRTLKIGKYVIPISKGRTELLRGGTAFWEILEKNGIPSTIFRVPSNFPPTPYGRSFAGMGTPDLLGGYGSFTFCAEVKPKNAGDITGGVVYLLHPKNGRAVCKVEGPENNLVKGHPSTSAEIEIWADPLNPSAKISAGGKTFILREGGWSDWTVLEFPMINHFVRVNGIVLLHLKKVHPRIELYVSPVNIDPTRPALPISNPSGYSKELARRIGYFYTQGMPEDTKALDHGIFTDVEFLRQESIFNNEVEKIYGYELARFKKGFMFFYFSDTDLTSHMFWSAMDPEHPQYKNRDAGSRRVIVDTYKKMDRMLGKALAALHRGDTIIVMSDHGFAPFTRGFHLNSWLADNGYLALSGDSDRDSSEFLDGVDWARTKAYALGFNAFYINLKDREGQGIVSPGDKKALMIELRRKLEALTDPKTGKHPISNIYFADEIYQKELLGDAPDMIVGYNRGFRASWETAIGKTPREWFSDNTEKWGGDHCIDAKLVPGIIFSNKKIESNSPALTDLAPTILSEFGLKKGRGMAGKNIF